MSYYYLKEESVMPPYFQFPELLLNMPISQTAKITYMVLYDRARLSQKNKWLDDEGHKFIIFPIKEICKSIGKGETVVKQALNDLDVAGLLKEKVVVFQNRIIFTSEFHTVVRFPPQTEIHLP